MAKTKNTKVKIECIQGIVSQFKRPLKVKFTSPTK
jgi:hypothetical protein